MKAAPLAGTLPAEISGQMTASGHLVNRTALAVGFTFFAIYLLSFGGVFHNSADEWLMFAVTESVAKRGEVNVDQLFWVGDYRGWARYGADGHLYLPYSNFSTAQQLAGIPAYMFGRLIRGAGLAQTTLLTNGVIVASTLSILLLLLSRLGYSLRIGLATIALIGLGTMLWPYAETYYGEPLLGLAVILCFYALTRWSGSLDSPAKTTHNGRSGWLLIAGGSLALAVLTKPAGVLLGPVGVLYVLIACRSLTPLYRVRNLATLLGPGLLAAIGILLFIIWHFRLDQGFLHTRGFETPAFLGWVGLLFSPGRGLFLYSPVALLAVPGLLLLLRRHRLLAACSIVFLLIFISFFASFAGWHGGRNIWGPRFLVPILPLLGLGVAALLAVPRARLVVWVIAFTLGVLGAAIQFLAVSNDYLPVMLDLARRYPADGMTAEQAATQAFFNWAEQPILLQLRNFTLANSDIAWLRGAGAIDKRSLLVLFSLLALSAGYLYCAVRRHGGPLLSWAPPALLLVNLAALAFVLPRFANHPRYAVPDYRQAIQVFDQLASDNAALVTLDATAQLAFNFQRRPNHRYGLSANEGTGPLSAPVQTLLQRLVKDHDELWIIGSEGRTSTVESEIRAALPNVEERVWGKTRLVKATGSR